MSTFSQNLFSFFFIFLFDSLIAVFVFYLSSFLMPQPIVQESSILKVRRVLYYGSIFGSAHGLITSLLILCFNPHPFYASALLTCLATSIVVVPGVFWFFKQESLQPLSQMRTEDIIVVLKLTALYSVIVSAILFIPSFLVGLLNGKIRSLFL